MEAFVKKTMIIMLYTASQKHITSKFVKLRSDNSKFRKIVWVPVVIVLILGQVIPKI